MLVDPLRHISGGRPPCVNTIPCYATASSHSARLQHVPTSGVHSRTACVVASSHHSPQTTLFYDEGDHLPTTSFKEEDSAKWDTASSSEPKFRPFVARDDLWRRITSFKREYPLAKGSRLLIQPVTSEWIEGTAELLTDTFAVSMGYVSVYRNFLKRQVRAYVKHHMNLVPKAVILVAILGSEDVDLGPVHDERFLESADAGSSTCRDDGRAAVDEDNGSPYSQASDASNRPRGDKPTLEYSCVSDLGDGMATGASLDSDRASDAEDTTPMTGNRSGGNNSQWREESVERPFSIMERDALEMNECTDGKQQRDSGTGSDDGVVQTPTLQELGAGQTLVACLEISFVEGTRSRYVTLNPPSDR